MVECYGEADEHFIRSVGSHSTGQNQSWIVGGKRVSVAQDVCVIRVVKIHDHRI